MKKPMKIAIAGHIQQFGGREIVLERESEVIENLPEYITQKDPNRRIKGHGNHKGFIPNNPKRKRK